MPRRPRKQPRASNSAATVKKSPALTRKGDAKMKKWVRREDIEGDAEDQFHDTRDRIFLEGEDAEGGEDWGDGEEEVFGLGLDDVSEDEDEGEEDEGDDQALDSDLSEASAPKPTKKTKKKALQKKDPSPPHSSADSGSESDEQESWGRTKSAYYASNAAQLADKEGEEDEEEANEMEEQEARRLQARLRDGMEDEDYGLGDVVDATVDDAILEEEEPAPAFQGTAVLPASGEKLDKATALRRLEKMSPETLALAREWDEVARHLVRVQDRLDKLESSTLDPVALGLSHLHHQTLLTYITTLAFYLHLRAAQPVTAQPQSQTPTRLKPVLARLLTLKQALATMEDLDFAVSDSEEDDDDDDSDFDEANLDSDELAELNRIFGPARGKYMKANSGRDQEMEDDMSEVWGRGKKKLGLGELEGLLRDADTAEERPRKKARMVQLKGTSGESYSGLEVNAVGPRSAKKKTKRDKTATTPSKPKSKPAFDLVEPTFIPSTRVGTRTSDNDREAFGEATALSIADDADKKARKRTLRFHTSRIETSARRREVGRERMGGDDDIPYRERKKEKEARVRREVEKTRGEGGDDLDPDGDVDMEGIAELAAAKRKRVVEDDEASGEEGEDGYYELVKRAKKEKKEGKKREYEEARMGDRVDVDGGPGGPRSLTRAILKNKGLTPHRSKSVRNPRVKKRERFEKAKKKVRSQKAVYKGGLSGKPYGGEESGITKVVKSVKL